jgi:hypothetical protein
MEDKRNEDDEDEIQQIILEEIRAMRENPARLDEELERLRDDARWPALPSDPLRNDDRSDFPTAERIRRHGKRRCSEFDVDPRIIEYYFLRRFRAVQWEYGRLRRVIDQVDRANGTDLCDSLDLALVGAFRLGQSYPPEEGVAKARNARLAEWHQVALVEAAKIIKKHPTYADDMNRLADLVFSKLDKIPNGPKSAETVRGCLRRKLDDWLDVQKKLDD